MPWRLLAALAATVLALHLAALRTLPVGPGARQQAASHRDGAHPVLWLRPMTTPAAAAPAAPAKAFRPAALESASAAPRAVSPDRGISPVHSAAHEPPVQAVAQAGADNAENAAATPAAELPGAAVPSPMRLHFQLRAQLRQGLVEGTADLVWRHDGQSYEARLELAGPATVSRTQRSLGRITPQGLVPQRFSEKVRSEQAVHFDADAGQVVFSSNRPVAKLLPGAQDRLSVLLQLGAVLAANPARYPLGTSLALQVATTREAEVWRFTLDGEETLQLPGGTVEAVRLVRLPGAQFDTRIELWLAPALDYAPVRLRLTQPNGEWVEQQWSGTDRG